jgi:hypothetical protein
MNLSTAQMALIFAACVLVIGGVVVAWQRGWLNKLAEPKPTHSGDTK